MAGIDAAVNARGSRSGRRQMMPVATDATSADFPRAVCRRKVVEADRDPMVEMCLTIDGYSTGRTSPTVRSNVGRFSGQVIEDLSS